MSKNNDIADANNKLIAEFMNVKKSNVTFFMTEPFWIESYEKDEDLKYHINWDWLMTAVSKIESLGFSTYIRWWYCVIGDEGDGIVIRSTRKEQTKLEATYESVVKFIKWYNLNRKKFTDREYNECDEYVIELLKVLHRKYDMDNDENIKKKLSKIEIRVSKALYHRVRASSMVHSYPNSDRLYTRVYVPGARQRAKVGIVLDESLILDYEIGKRKKPKKEK